MKPKPKQEPLQKLFEKYFPGRSEKVDYLRMGICSKCTRVTFIDPPGGPLKAVPLECSYKICEAPKHFPYS